MSSSLTHDTATDSAFICDCEEWMRPACAGEPFYQEDEGERYCVLHYPGKDKSAPFAEALKRKLDAQNFDFRGVSFPGPVDFSAVVFGTKVYFCSAHFSAEADFSGAAFSGEADFTHASFIGEADFFNSTFSAVANFNSAHFSGETNFSATIFKAEVNFSYIVFSGEADFSGAAFSATADFSFGMFRGAMYFTHATFSAKANFATTIFSAAAYFSAAAFSAAVDFSTTAFRAEAYFISAKIEKPDLVSFPPMFLRPYSLVDVKNARELDLTNVDWDWRGTNLEIGSLKALRISSPHRMLVIACRRLADNAEEERSYEDASRFRFMAMEARRLESWRGFALWRLSWWYWLASGYGENVGQAFLILLAILALFAILYTMTGHLKVNTWQDALGALNYSLSVATLQKPEPKSVAGLTPLLITLETIVGAVQAALLALAIRRKFMR